MFVVKRDGRQEPVHFDKITSRIVKLSYGLNPEFCDPVRGGAGAAGSGGRASSCAAFKLGAAPPAPAPPDRGGGGALSSRGRRG